jgi:L-seryl-tRNA(Ser) seleniumtransferase
MTDYRVIPSIEQLRQRAAIRALEHDFGREAILDALRGAAAAFRADLSAGLHDSEDGRAIDQETAARLLERDARARLLGAGQPSLRPVVNATGVVIHTNLGRAPLARAALDRIGALGAGYSNLEYDLDSGSRGARDTHAEALLCTLLDAESAVVVNNNAAATMLLLAALAAGREVVVSRGELVEIGGGFRIPEIMEQSGAVLREVGTTNKTRTADYARAITDRTALLLRVHRSNFRIEGFTERPALDELAALARERGVPLAEDLGSGYLGLPGDARGATRLDAVLASEPTVQQTLAAGVALCCFSGDKLLGGPQAGILVGRRDLVDRIRRHPLMRALRVDKLTYAALEATLGEYAAGRAASTVPIMRMLLASAEELQERCTRVQQALLGAGAGLHAEVRDAFSTVGGGTTPGLAIPTRVLAVTSRACTADALDARLRAHVPPVVGRIEDDRLLLDVRTVLPEQDGTLTEALLAAASSGD